MAADDSTSSHDEFDKLAVEHVLGGLDATSSSRFRDHLATCRDCRQRVVELRGIAADLEVAEREERRQAARTKVETARRDPAPEPPRSGVRLDALRIVALVAAVVALAVMAFWNIHLREVRSQLEASLAERGQVLDVLVEGEIVAVDTPMEGVRALVAADGDRVAIDADGLPAISADQRIVVWSQDAEGLASPIAFVGAANVPDGRLVVAADEADGVRLLVTIEGFPLGEVPGERVVLTADLA